jgi:hypothetical protein
MPMGFAPLEPGKIALLQRWIEGGALPAAEKKKHWAYVKPVRPAMPLVKQKGWVRNPIDDFVLARLEKEGLRPSPEADKATLIRRLTLDLTGLPPTLAEVDAFLADKSPDAYEKVVDRLFKSPHYGERMALPWLDAARYADSNGFQQDGDTHQYVWRDWVVKALNDNMSFREFTLQQIAGDLLPGANAADEKGRAMLIASGFNRNNMLNGEGGAIAEEQRNVVLFDRVDTTSTTWMGLTMGCARCHDHKYDPLSQKEYFRMMAYFNRVPENGVPSGGGQYRLDTPWIYAGDQKQVARLALLDAQMKPAEARAKRLVDSDAVRQAESAWRKDPVGAPDDVRKLVLGQRNPDQEQQVHEYFLAHVLKGGAGDAWRQWQSMRRELEELRAQLPRVMIMSDRRKRDTFVYNRGNYTEPREKVMPGTPEVLGRDAAGNRLDLARWIVSPENPLTARVQVNRYWQLFFGKGLVRTPENFGAQGEPPTHPELLDWLAVEFMKDWNVKRIHRLIVTSATYRQSSKMSRGLLAKDPDNRLLARASRFRLPSMILRDVALASSGLLNPKMGGKPVYPYQPAGIWDGLSITKERDFTYPQSKGADLYRRSIYTFWRRTVAPGNMFDSSSRQVCTVRPSLTSTPLHALTTLNDPTWVEAAKALGSRALTRYKQVDPAIKFAFRSVMAREPRPSEIQVLRKSFEDSLAEYRVRPEAAHELLSIGEATVREGDRVGLAAFTSICLLILNLDEALSHE